MKPASMVSKTVDFTITLTCFLSATSSYLGLSSNTHLPLLLSNIESIGKSDIRKYEFRVSSLAYTVKLSKDVHTEKYKHQWLLTDTLSSVMNSILQSLNTLSYNGTDIIKVFRSKKLLRKYGIANMEEFNANSSGLYQVKWKKNGNR